VQIDGQVDGEIELEGQVTIGEGGRLVGQVVARSVRVAGTVEGNLRATERIELLASGSIEGDVLTPRLAIHEGGLCRGRVEMRRPQERSEATAASTVLPSTGDPEAGRLAAEAKVHPGR
jgi:cytoskeletal protein CcmA (bactofilin family)